MVLLLELEFCVLTIMKKGASHHPQPSKISPSSSAAVRNPRASWRKASLLLPSGDSVLQHPALPPAGCRHHILLTAFSSCMVEAKYAQPRLSAIYKVTTNQEHSPCRTHCQCQMSPDDEAVLLCDQLPAWLMCAFGFCSPSLHTAHAHIHYQSWGAGANGASSMRL